jgi:pectinesterase
MKRALTKGVMFIGVILGWLAVAMPGDAQVLFPADKATMVNPDVQLKLTFKETPGIGKSGKIRIYDAADDRLVDMLDMSIPPGPTKPVDPGVRAKNYLAFPYPYERTSRPTNANTKAGTPSAGATPTSSTDYQLLKATCPKVL